MPSRCMLLLLVLLACTGPIALARAHAGAATDSLQEMPARSTRSASADVPTVWHQCASVPIVPGPTDTSLCVTLEFTDCDMHVLLEAEGAVGGVTLLNQTLKSVEVDDPELRWCKDLALGCTACLKFSNVSVDENEVGSGCVVVTSTCSMREYPIGCFEDIPRVDVCAASCPNDCSDNGVCNFDGTCECNDGFEGVDCSSGCDPTPTGSALAMGEYYSSLKTDKKGVWEGHVGVEDGKSEVMLSLTISEHDEYEFKVKRGCRPDEDDYDLRFSLDGTAHEHVTRQISENCPEDAGDLFFLAKCKKHAPCSFDIQLSQVPIVELEAGKVLSDQHTRASLLYTFALASKNPITVQVTSSTPYGELTLLPGYCPNRDIFLASATTPSFSGTISGNSEEQKHVMVVEELDPDVGTWFVRYDACASSAACTEASFSIVVSEAACKEVCEDGFCSGSNKCTCNSEDSSVYARPKVCGVSPADESNPSTEGSLGPYHSISVSGDEKDSTLMYVAVGAVLMVMVVIAAGSVIGFALWKKRRPPPTLYNMLSEEEDIF